MRRSVKRKLYWVVFVIIVLAVIYLPLSASVVKAGNSQRVNDRKYFTNYTVQKDDSLWNIAERYITAEYEDIRDYIREIQESNGLSSDHICAGEVIVLPYYADQPMYTAVASN